MTKLLQANGLRGLIKYLCAAMLLVVSAQVVHGQTNSAPAHADDIGARLASAGPRVSSGEIFLLSNVETIIDLADPNGDDNTDDSLFVDPDSGDGPRSLTYSFAVGNESAERRQTFSSSSGVHTFRIVGSEIRLRVTARDTNGVGIYLFACDDDDACSPAYSVNIVTYYDPSAKLTSLRSGIGGSQVDIATTAGSYQNHTAKIEIPEGTTGAVFTVQAGSDHPDASIKYSINRCNNDSFAQGDAPPILVCRDLPTAAGYQIGNGVRWGDIGTTGSCGTNDTAEGDFDFFSINPSTGAVRVTGELDHETPKDRNGGLPAIGESPATTGSSGDNVYRLRIAMLNTGGNLGFGRNTGVPGCTGEVLDLEITVTDAPDIDLTVQPTTVYEGGETVITVTAAGNDAMPLYDAATTIVFTPAGGGSDPAESNDYSVDSAMLTLEIPACATRSLETDVCDEANPANTNSITGTFTLTVPTDADLEGDETLFLTASASTPSEIAGALPLMHDFVQATTTITIADVFSVRFSSAGDDPNAPAEGPSVSEDAEEIEFVVTVDPAPVDRPVTVTYTTSDSVPPSAMEGQDYTETMGTLTFDPGETTKTITVAILEDEAPEEDETFMLTLGQLSGNGIVMDQTITATILANDSTMIQFIGDDPPVVTAMEDDGEIVFSVEITGDVSGNVTVQYQTQTADPPTVGSARSEAAKDYESTSGTLTFTSSLTAASVTVPLVADDTHETDETFTMRLANPQGAILGTKSMATGTITDDDDAPVLSIRGEANRAVTEGDGSIVLTVEASNRSARETTVAFQTAPGSATAGEDFTSVTGTLTMTADSGNLHANVATGTATAAVTVTVPSDQAPAFPITIPITADAETEDDTGDETFTFSLAAIPAADPSGLANARVGPAVTVTIRELKPSFGSNMVPDQGYSLGRAVTLTLPAVDREGNGATAYALTPDLPAGLMFDADTRVISGAPTELRDETLYTYTATDEDDDTDMITFNIAVAASEPMENPGPVFDEETEDAVEDQSFRQNESITRIVLPEVDQDGTGTTTYKVEPDLPPGLTFDPDTRTISGTPTVPQKPTTYTYTATDENGISDTIEFSITVPGPVFDDGAGEDLRYDTSEPLDLPEAQGGSGDITYTVEPDLPPGVTFDPDTRTISGTPTGPAGEDTYTYTATDEGGNTITIMFTIIVPDVEPSFGDKTVEDVEYDADEPVTLPEAQGGNGDIAYKVEPDLPPGLSFDPDTRTISGAPTGPAGETTFTYTATDAEGDTATLTFKIIVPDVDISFGDKDVEDQVYSPNIVGDPLTLPTVEQAGNGATIYRLAPDLPAGLTFDADTRILSGTPTQLKAQTAYTYTAADQDDDTDTITFSITVKNDPPEAMASANPTEAEPGQTVTLDGSQSTDPDGGALNYQWQPSDDAPDIALTGTTLSMATFTAPSNLAQDTQLVFTLTVTDPGKLTDTAEVTVTVKAGLDLAMVMEGSLGIFGRSVAAGVVDAVSDRFDIPSTVRPSELVVAGRTLNLNASGREIGWSALRMLGFNIGGDPGGLAYLDDAGTQPRANGIGNHFQGRLHGGAGAVIALPAPALLGGDLRHNSAFELGLGNGSGLSGDYHWMFWGRGDKRNSTMRTSDTLFFDGDTTAMMVGMELRNERNVFGGAVSLSGATVEFRERETTGEIDLSLTSIFPYWHSMRRNNLSFWTTAGIGWGNAEYAHPRDANSQDAEIDVDIAMQMVAAGLRKGMAPVRGFDMALKGDAYIAQLTADEFEQYLPETSTGLQRLRFGIEASKTYGENPVRMKPSFELNARIDSGGGIDEGPGIGIEAGGGFAYVLMEWGTMLEVKYRYLVATNQDDFQDWGATFMLRVDPGGVGGAAFSLSPTWGQTASWSDVMWNDDRWRQELQNHRGRDRPGNGLRPERVDAALHYTFRLNAWNVEPFSTFGQGTSSHGDWLQTGLRIQSFELGRMSKNIASGDMLLELFDQRSNWFGSGSNVGQGLGARGTVRMHFF